MAERRMLTRKVTDDDRFMNLSSSAQALYLHLSMNADDDGFCNQVSVQMFRAHASVQDLEALLSARFIYQFESGVIVIKHWRMANALRKDRYTQTTFKEELSKLSLDENGAYTMSHGCHLDAERLPDGCQTDAECLPQVRLGKVSIDKDRLDNKSSDFDRFWSAYPKKVAKEAARKAFKKVKVPVDELIKAVEAQKGSDAWRRDNGQYIPNPSTWLNQGRWDDEVRTAEATGAEPDIWEEYEREEIARMREAQERMRNG